MESPLERDAREALSALDREGARRKILSGSGVDFASNDYLGLRDDPRVIEAAHAALAEYGLGAGAARLLRGDHAPHRALERAFAERQGAEDGLLFPTGYQANYGVLQTLAGEGWTIVSDANNHASIIDGCRAAAARVKIAAHNDVSSFARNIENEKTLVIIESVYSMSGDRAPVEAISELCRDTGASLIVDEAHALGLFPAEGDAAIRIHPCGKAFGGAGAVVTGPHAVLDLLRSRCRTFLFTTALPPMVAAGVLAAMKIADAEPGRAERALANARRIDPEAVSCIVPVPCRSNEDALRRQGALAERGLDVRAVRPPTVPNAMLRICAHAAHTDDEIARLRHALHELAVENGS